MGPAGKADGHGHGSLAAQKLLVFRLVSLETRPNRGIPSPKKVDPYMNGDHVFFSAVQVWSATGLLVGVVVVFFGRGQVSPAEAEGETGADPRLLGRNASGKARSLWCPCGCCHGSWLKASGACFTRFQAPRPHPLTRTPLEHKGVYQH